MALQDGRDHRRCRLLVRTGGLPRGTVELPVTDGGLALEALRRAAADLPPAAAAGGLPQVLPTVTVVICCHERPADLAAALGSALQLDYPRLEVLVVDVTPRTDAVARVVAAADDRRVERIVAPLPGMARARNWALRQARGEIVAFTDDTVVVDPQWVRALVAGFARDPGVVCVSGLVPSGELRTPAQAWFDHRMGWARRWQPQLFRLDDPPAGVPAFPFQVGLYGSGANLALHRAVAIDLGGFDEALGPGLPTRAGEDVDMFLRVLVSGHTIAYEPAAVVWFRHCAEVAQALDRARGFGIGLGAWLTKAAVERTTAPLAWRRAPAALRRLRALAPVAGAEDRMDPEVAEIYRLVGRSETRAVAAGPARYALARLRGSARPIRLDRRPRWDGG